MPHDHDSHHHGNGHTHSHAPADFGRAFAWGTAANFAYVLLEAGFGLASGSLALLADAGHNMSDVLGLLMAWGAATLARRPPTPRRTYGWRRGSILAALGNAALLFIAIGAITWEALRRLIEGSPAPATDTILWVAAVGLVVNLGTALLFWSGRKNDLNIRGTFLHMMADAGVTLGVILAALGMRWTKWTWLDPTVSLAIAGVILVGTWRLARELLQLAMDAVPAEIDPQQVSAWLAGQPGVTQVHDLHVWALGTTETALTVHLLRPAQEAPDDGFLSRLRQGLRHDFGIGHATIQVERGDPEHPCPQAAPGTL